MSRQPLRMVRASVATAANGQPVDRWPEYFDAEGAALYLGLALTAKHPASAFRKAAAKAGLAPVYRLGDKPLWKRAQIDRAVALTGE